MLTEIDFQMKCFKLVEVGITCVVEPPKLYGPHMPTIVFQTSDSCTCKPDNSGILSGVLGGNPNHPQFYNSYRINKGVVTTLQHLI
jgi:hypothetical protein